MTTAHVRTPTAEDHLRRTIHLLAVMVEDDNRARRRAQAERQRGPRREH